MVDSKCRVPGATLERGSIGTKNIIVRPLAQSFLVYFFEKICVVRLRISVWFVGNPEVCAEQRVVHEG
jgi:hypothetical protein